MTRRHTRALGLIAALLALTPLAAAAQASETPFVIPHSGRLLDNADKVVNATVRMKFTLNTTSGIDPNATNQVKWTQEFAAVPVTGGFYYVELGRGDEAPIGPAVFEGGPRWLGIEVDGQPLSPRLRVGSAAYAVNAGSAKSADDAKKLGGHDAAYFTDAANLVGTLGADVTYAGAPLEDAQVKGAAKWNAKLDTLAVAAPLSGSGTTTSPLALGAASASADGYVKKEDFAGWLTKTGAAETYQPKGDYLTTAAGTAAFQPKGEYLVAGATGVAAPTGAVKLGDVTGECNTGTAGVVRWTGTQFEGCNGTKWGPMAGASSAAAPNPANSGANFTIPAGTNGSFVRVNLTANTTVTLPAGPDAANTVARLNVEVKQDATGTRTVAWATPSGDELIWDGATSAPAASRGAGIRTIYEFWKLNGDTTWRGKVVFRETRVVPGETVLRCTNNTQNFTVPDGVTSVSVKAWGAGGAGGSQSGAARPLLVGGGGGYAAGTLDVNPGEVLTVIVGCGGVVASDQGGGGGGRSAVRRGSIEVLTAGGGGGGSYDAWGGAGGGTTGQQGGSGNQYSTGANGGGGGGGTQSSGGAASTPGSGSLTGPGPTAGTQFTGGRGNGSFQGGTGGFGGGGNGGSSDGGGGGGGGYFGGGGGFGHSGGGGGSSFIPAGGSTLAGSGLNPGNSGDPEREGAGNGGTAKATGGDGLVRIKWGT